MHLSHTAHQKANGTAVCFLSQRVCDGVVAGLLGIGGMKRMIGKVSVVNRKSFDKGIWPEGYVYCGRAMAKSGYKGTEERSPLANPHWSSNESDRSKVIEQFKETLHNSPLNSSIWEEIKRLCRVAASGDDVTLVCWCKPKACHCDWVKEIIERTAPRYQEQGSAEDEREE